MQYVVLTHKIDDNIKLSILASCATFIKRESLQKHGKNIKRAIYGIGQN